MKRLIFALFLSVLPVCIVAAQSSVRWKSEVKHIKDDLYEIRITAEIGSGLHIYDLGPYKMGEGPLATSFAFDTHQGKPKADPELEGSAYQITTPHRYHDQTFGIEVGTFEGSAVFGQKVRMGNIERAVIGVSVEWQACTDGKCLIPEDSEFSVTVTGQQPALGTQPSETDTLQTGEADNTPDEVPAISNSSQPSSRSLGALVGEAILWGLLALLTPCVFPMLPMTVSFFMKNGGRKRAIFYGISIIALYVLPFAAIILITRIVGGETVTSDIFNWLATHWLPNIIFFAVFMIFAASFFGAFEIVLPSGLANKADRRADRGGFFAIFFMALVLVLVSFSCTGPLVATVITRSLAGEFWTPILTITIFATVFAIPFVFFAFFPTLLQKLPRSGGWLNSVKVVLGFVEVALGLKFLSIADQTYHWGILDREVYLAIWIVVATLLGLYLLGKLKFKHDSDLKYISVGRLTLAIVSFSFAVYLLPGMWGAPLRGLSGYLPPLATQDFVLTSGTGSAPVATLPEAGKRKYADFLHAPFDGLDIFFDYREGMEYAERVGKPVLLDFTGESCVNCREMESRVWLTPTVREILTTRYVVISIPLDTKTTMPEADWVTTETGKTLKSLGRINSYFAYRRFGVAGQPTYIVMGRGERQLMPPRGYNLDVQAYIDFLSRGLEEYNK